MAALSHFLLFLVAVSVAAAQQQQLNISLTSSLTPISNSSWTSPSGLYAFGFYRKADGYAVGIFLAGIREKTVFWTAVRDNPPFPENATLLFDSDSKLVLRSGQDQDIYIANSTDTPTSASMLDSGNFVLYNSVHRVIWQSFDFPTDTLLPGQRLLASTEQQLFPGVSETDKSTGIFRLQMQADGNLVQYPDVYPVTSWHAYWSSGTFTYGNNVTLNFDQDGRLYLLNATTNIQNITEGGNPTKDRIHLIRLDPDGIFRLYMHNLTDDSASWSILWNSTNNKCAPKGLCGMNAFCTTNDQDVKCECLPGFAPVSEGNQTSGCKKNFTSKSCMNNGPGSSVDYSMREVISTVWEDTSFESLSSLTKDQCKEACFEDCNCEAVLYYTIGVCRKQRLPLRFGARSLDNSITALIKVGSSTSGATGEPSSHLAVAGNGIWELKLKIGLGISAVVAVLIIISVFLVWRKYAQSNYVMFWKRKTKNFKNIEVFLEDFGSLCPKRFSYFEIKKITSSFKDKLGEGGFGGVYRGELQDGRPVAVKVLKGSKGDGEDFINEVSSISKTSHINVVTLLGFCFEGHKRALVYEFMPNGSLEKFIYEKSSLTSDHQLNWETLYKIAVGIARGLEYLHRGCNMRILHFDIKPHNILLDQEFCPKICDFGLAKICPQKESIVSMVGARGTPGYIAPEVFSRNFGGVSHKSDVYSYGMMVLEMVGGRRNIDCGADRTSELYFPHWIYKRLELNQELGLHGITGDEEKEEARKMIIVSMWCIRTDPSNRPSMSRVVEMLEGRVDSLQIPPAPFLSSPSRSPASGSLLTVDQYSSVT